MEKFLNRLEPDKEEQRVLLKALQSYAVAAVGKIKLPSVVYLDQIAGQLGVTRSRARDIAEEFRAKFFKVTDFNLRQSEGLGMWNATADLGKVVNLDTIQRRVEREGLPKNKADIEVLRFTTRYGRMQKAYEYTSEYGGRVIAKNKSISSVEYIMRVGGTQGASLSIFNTGRIRMSGGYLTSTPKKILNFILPGVDIPIQINNVTSKIVLAATVNTDTLENILDVPSGLARFRNYTLKSRLDPPFLYVAFDDAFTLVISKSGTVVIEGAADIKKAVDVTQDFLEALKDSGLLTPSARNVRARPKKTQVAKRADNRPAPEITRRGTSCPVGRRPSPYSYEGKCPRAGDYIRPNPQGQPCCYGIPKKIDYSRNKVREAYRKADVRVPESVRKIFGFGENTNEKKTNVGREAPKLDMYVDPKVGFKIGTRQCARYSKVALVDMAIRLGIPLPKKVTKPILCDLLLKKSQMNK